MDGRHHNLFPGQLAKARMSQGQTAYGAGNTHTFVRIPAIVLFEHGGRGRAGSGLPVFDHNGFAVGGMDDHETAAANVAGGGIGDGHGEGGGHGGIDGVAALEQDVASDLGTRRRHGHDNAVMVFARFVLAQGFQEGNGHKGNEQQDESGQVVAHGQLASCRPGFQPA